MDGAARRELLVAAAVTVVVLAGALLLDPGVRASLASTPAIRALLCDDGVVVSTLTNDGNLTVPEGGLAVRVHDGERDVPARLELHRRDPGGDWDLHWSLDAPAGREVFYVATVQPGTEVYVLALPTATEDCPARSGVVAAPAGHT